MSTNNIKIIIITRKLAYPELFFDDSSAKTTYHPHHLTKFFFTVILENINQKFSAFEEKILYFQDFCILHEKNGLEIFEPSNLNTRDDSKSLKKYISAISKKFAETYFLDNKLYAVKDVEIKIENTKIKAEAIFVFWDKMPKHSFFSPKYYSEDKGRNLELIQAICDDCKLEENSKPEENINNVLYIHDDEWGKFKHDAIIIKNSKIVDNSLITDYEHSRLRLYFSNVMVFRHIGVGSNTTIFDTILNSTYIETNPLILKIQEHESLLKDADVDFLNVIKKIKEETE